MDHLKNMKLPNNMFAYIQSWHAYIEDKNNKYYSFDIPKKLNLFLRTQQPLFCKENISLEAKKSLSKTDSDWQIFNEANFNQIVLNFDQNMQTLGRDKTNCFNLIKESL